MSEEADGKIERSRLFVLILMLVTTVFSAVLAGLQTDASIHADRDNIQSQYYAMLASAEIFRQGQQTAYDLDTLSTYLRFAQKSTVLNFSALELENSGDPEGAARLRYEALITGARAESVRQISRILQDERFAPTSADGMPDMQAYMNSQLAQADELTQKQNQAADHYHYWDDKADSYLTILSMLALVFFLLGVAQNSRNLRLFFALAASGILLICVFWSLWALLI